MARERSNPIPMPGPKVLGALLIVYAIVGKSLDAIAVLAQLHRGIHVRDWWSLILVSRQVLEAPYFVAYIVGSIGLLSRQRWGNLVVLLTASTEVVVTVIAVLADLALFMFHGPVQQPGTAMIFLMVGSVVALAFPVAIWCMSSWLRRHSEAWRPVVGRVQRSHEDAPSRPIRRKRRARRWFLATLASGASLPWLTGVAARAVLKGQGKPVVAWSYLFGQSWAELPFSLLLLLVETAVLGAVSLPAAFLARGIVLREPTPDAPLSDVERDLMAGGVLLGFSISTASLFYYMWQDASVAMMMIFSAPLALLVVGALGAALGFGLGRAIVALNRRPRYPFGRGG